MTGLYRFAWPKCLFLCLHKWLRVCVSGESMITDKSDKSLSVVHSHLSNSFLLNLFKYAYFVWAQSDFLSLGGWLSCIWVISNQRYIQKCFRAFTSKILHLNQTSIPFQYLQTSAFPGNWQCNWGGREVLLLKILDREHYSSSLYMLFLVAWFWRVFPSVLWLHTHSISFTFCSVNLFIYLFIYFCSQLRHLKEFEM